MWHADSRPRGLAALAILLSIAVPGSVAAFSPAKRCSEPPEHVRPADDDHSALALQTYQEAWLRCHGGDDYRVPLDRKADHYEWQLWRYHFGPHRQVMPRIMLPESPGEPVDLLHGADVSTWNGALLAALGHAWGARRDPVTLERIGELLEGMHLFQRVTGTPGLPARFVIPSDEPVGKAIHPWVAPDGTRFFYRDEPAKGTVNQLVLGYATALTFAGTDLPDPARRRAHEDLSALVTHLVRHDWKLTRADGATTRYGNLSPIAFGVPLPFNAQVAAMIASAGRRFPPSDPTARTLVEEAWQELRRREPWRRSPWMPPFFAPQRVGTSRFLGVNDLNHLVNATFTALLLELDAARHEAREPDRELLRGLARTIEWSEGRLLAERNALGLFMWAALLRDPQLQDALDLEPQRVAPRVRRLLDVGVEQLRRFPVDRFRSEGVQARASEPQWVDRYRPDSYHWKVDPHLLWIETGGPTPLLYSALDYLHAYWLFRNLGLERDPALPARHFQVLGRR